MKNLLFWKSFIWQRCLRDIFNLCPLLSEALQNKLSSRTFLYGIRPKHLLVFFKIASQWRSTVKVFLVVDTWLLLFLSLRYSVSLRIQSECGKIRTRKNSRYGHFSRSEACARPLQHLRWRALQQQLKAKSR